MTAHENFSIRDFVQPNQDVRQDLGLRAEDLDIIRSLNKTSGGDLQQKQAPDMGFKDEFNAIFVLGDSQKAKEAHAKHATPVKHAPPENPRTENNPVKNESPRAHGQENSDPDDKQAKLMEGIQQVGPPVPPEERGANGEAWRTLKEMKPPTTYGWL